MPQPDALARLLAPEGGPWRDLFESGPWGAALLDTDGRIVLANRALAVLAGADDAARLVGLEFASLFAPGQRFELRAALARALGPAAEAQDSPVIADLPATPGSEQPVAAMIAFTPIAGTSGSGASGVAVRVVDVSAQRRLEQQLAQAQKMHAIGQLAAGIAHDFRNLLSAIGLIAEELQNELDGNAAVLRELAQIRRCTGRGEGLVTKLLAFARKQPMQPRVVVLNDAIEDLSMLLRRFLGAPVSLVMDLDPPRRAVRVDPVQFEQVIVNLVLNARAAMPRGGRVTVRTGQVNLFRPLIRGRETIPPGRYAMVEVEDTGTGIPEAFLDRIFEPFFTTRKESGGTGLGLSTVWGIVRQMEGFVTVDSTPGEGTTFRVYLPRVDGVEETERSLPASPPAPPAAATDAAGRDPGKTSRGTVLLAEDEDTTRRLAALALAREGWQVLQARAGDEAIAVIAKLQAPLNALVTDMMMPGADGEAVVRAARARWPGLPVIVTSGYSESQGSEDFDRLGVTWLAKPYTLRDLGRVAAGLAGDGNRRRH